MFAGRQLEDGQMLGACGVTDDSQMYVLMRLLGGAKKRKKKTYTKPKKQKHKCVGWAAVACCGLLWAGLWRGAASGVCSRAARNAAHVRAGVPAAARRSCRRSATMHGRLG